MTEKEATIFDPNADIEAVAIRYDTGSETWQLHAVGTWEECRQSCLRTKNKGCEDQMRVIRAVHGAMYFNGETDKVVIGPDGHGVIYRDYSTPEKPEPQPSEPMQSGGHGTFERGPICDRALTPNEIKDLAMNDVEWKWVATMLQPDISVRGDEIARNDEP